LSGIGVQQEKGLDLLDGGLVRGRTALDHVALGVTDQPMGIQRQDLALEVTAGPAQFA
jgi:hypothetical protein